MDLGDVDPRSLIGKGTIGLLNSTGTYDVTRYPWAYDCWKRQQQTHWMGEEVPLGADIKDWQSGHLTDAEKGSADPDFPLLHPVATWKWATITSSATSRSSSRWKCR